MTKYLLSVTLVLPLTVTFVGPAAAGWWILFADQGTDALTPENSAVAGEAVSGLAVGGYAPTTTSTEGELAPVGTGDEGRPPALPAAQTETTDEQ